MLPSTCILLPCYLLPVYYYHVTFYLYTTTCILLQEVSHNLEDQQLNKDNVPVLVEKCVEFISLHGKCYLINHCSIYSTDTDTLFYCSIYSTDTDTLFY